MFEFDVDTEKNNLGCTVEALFLTIIYKSISDTLIC